jgi:hypothetical protein
MKKLENVRKVKLNGRDAKLFDVREFVDGAWLFAGTYSAPVRTANKKLLELYEAQA